MKKSVREISLNDLKFQIIIGIVLVLLIFVSGFMFLNNQIANSCANSNLAGDLNLLKSNVGLKKTISPALSLPCFDSDGFDLNTLGYVEFKGSINYDRCTGPKSIIEWLCNAYGSYSVPYDCPKIPSDQGDRQLYCYNGRCIIYDDVPVKAKLCWDRKFGDDCNGYPGLCCTGSNQDQYGSYLSCIEVSECPAV